MHGHQLKADEHVRQREEARERGAASAQTAGCEKEEWSRTNGRRYLRLRGLYKGHRAGQGVVMVPAMHELLTAKERDGGRRRGEAFPLARRGLWQRRRGGVRVAHLLIRPIRRNQGRLRSATSRWSPGKVESFWRQPNEHVSGWLARSHGGVTKRCAGPSRDRCRCVCGERWS